MANLKVHLESIFYSVKVICGQDWIGDLDEAFRFQAIQASSKNRTSS